MPPVGANTPLRRKMNISITSVQTTVSSISNDDEVERVSRRSNINENEQEISPLGQDNANLIMWLQQYQDNKINKENAWKVSIIDNLGNLIQRHHKSMNNFQVAGSSLEASTKVYVLRVDSLHSDALRMVADLSRQSARQLHHNEDDEEDDNQMNDSADKENNPDGANKQETNKKKRKKSRRTAAVITKNPDSLNAKLDTNPFTDPFFAKLNSIVGDINSSSRLMQNMIGSKNGALKLRMDTPFWDPTPKQAILHDENEKYENRDFICVHSLDITEKHVWHQRLHAYLLSDAPAEDDEDDEPPPEFNHENTFNKSMGNTGAAVQFDPHAEIEPIEAENDFIMDCGVTDQNDFEEMAEEDRDAIVACRGLRRVPVTIEDMRPVDGSSSNLEYSYRPLDMISQYWAGPSHWKFRRTRSTMHRSLASTPSVASEEKVGSVNAKKRKTRRKKGYEPCTKVDACTILPDPFLQRTSHRKLKTNTLTKGLISKKWIAKKLRLPTDLKFEKDMFDVFKFGPQVRVKINESEVEPDLAVSEYNYANDQDKDYCRQMNCETDVETETDFGGTEPDPVNTSDENIPQVDAPPLNQTIDFIGTEFAGAPDKVEKITIAYAKRAKPVDMKQLKMQCWRLISEVAKDRPATPVENCPENLATQVEFTEIYDRLPNVLSKSMAENMSISLAFYSVLHLANEKDLKLVQHEDLDGFSIAKLEEN